MKSLSLKLTFFFTLLIITGVILLTGLIGFIESKILISNTINQETVEGVVEQEKTYIARALQQKDFSVWLHITVGNLAKSLVAMEFSGDTSGTINELIEPEVYIQITDIEGEVVYTFPESLPEKASQIFMPKENKLPQEEELTAQDFIRVKTSLIDNTGNTLGTLDLMFIGVFDCKKFIIEELTDYLEYWPYNMFIFVTLSLGCGLVANRFVAGPLKLINTATDEWCRGNFSMRIKVQKEGGDILAEHSRNLNSMADELEKLLFFKEQSAMMAERNRVARELHDTVKQNLFALKLQLAACKGKNTLDEAFFHIDEAQKIAADSQREIMEILTHLSFAAQVKNNFYGRMAELAGDVQRRLNVSIVWQQQEQITVSPEQEHALVRLAREAINNAVRHGKASIITMNLFKEDGTVRWTITDNGCGLPPDGTTLASDKSSASGLIFMRERTAVLSESRFSIDNAVGGGVVICIQWRV